MEARTLPPVIRLNPEDGVVIARGADARHPGRPGRDGRARRIPPGHKVAARMPGRADPPLRPDHRLRDRMRSRPATGCTPTTAPWAISPATTPRASMRSRRAYVDAPATFMGIRRADGRVATRNYIGIVTSVNCSAHVADLIARSSSRNPITGEDPLADWPNVDGVVALTHKTGCGMTMGEPLRVLRRTLAGFARHANFSHVIAIGLGCEVNQLGPMLEEQKLAGRLRSMDIQEIGGTRKTVEAGIAFVKRGAGRSQHRRREAVPAAELMRRPAMRRLGRVFRHHRQPGAGRRVGPGGAAWRHGDPVGNARDLWRRTSADAPRRLAARSARSWSI